jgi:hypothetical protein
MRTAGSGHQNQPASNKRGTWEEKINRNPHFETRATNMHGNQPVTSRPANKSSIGGRESLIGEKGEGEEGRGQDPDRG